MEDGATGWRTRALEEMYDRRTAPALGFREWPMHAQDSDASRHAHSGMCGYIHSCNRICAVEIKARLEQTAVITDFVGQHAPHVLLAPVPVGLPSVGPVEVAGSVVAGVDPQNGLGPRTLPILIPVGLATADQITDYTQDIRMIEPMLGKLPPEERAALLLVEVNDRLQSAGVPIIENLEFDSTLNQFDSKTWTMTVGLNTLADPMKAAATMYHEARHAEQAFRIARMLAGRKPQPSNQEIGRRAGIDDPDIVQAAVDQKIDPETTEATQAEGWHEDEPGRPSRQQQNARQATTAERFRQAAKRFKQNPTEHNHAVAAAAYEDFKAAQIDAYRNQPNEYDAFFVEEKVGDLLCRAIRFPSARRSDRPGHC